MKQYWKMAGVHFTYITDKETVARHICDTFDSLSSANLILKKEYEGIEVVDIIRDSNLHGRIMSVIYATPNKETVLFLDRETR